MKTFHCTIATTEREINDAQRLRWNVYGEEERLLPGSACVGGREIDDLDYRASTTHFLVYEGQEPVGTVRLLEPGVGSEQPIDGRIGLDLDSKFDLSALAAPWIRPAEVTRFCVLRQYRRTGVTAALFAALHAESSRRGVTHWVAGANMETDCPEDAALAFRAAQAKNLMSPRFRADLRANEQPETPRRRPCYTPEQRIRALEGDLSGIEVPRVISLFAAGMGARYIGPPVYDTYFNIFALPLVSTLADIAVRQGKKASRAPNVIHP